MNSLKVYYNNKLVGTIKKSDKLYFQYDEEWVKNGFSISPLSLPLKNELFVSDNNAFDGLFGVFADSLPDSWGKLLLTRYLKKNRPNDKIDEILFLSCIGKNGMGALEYKPEENNDDYKFEIDYDDIQREADYAIDGLDYDIDKLYKLGGSSGGARPKALVSIDGEKWIVKFQYKYDIKDAGLVEYEYALACKEIGINIPEVKLIKSNVSNGYFAIKRFDRKNENKIHMISVAALLEADFNSSFLDYNDLFKITKFLTYNDYNDLNELFLRMCFNVYAHNLDDHIKNFSFIYDEKINRYKLSPAYDMTYSNTSFNEHTTTVNGKGKDILDIDLINVGIKAGLKEKECIVMLNKVKDVINDKLKKYL